MFCNPSPSIAAKNHFAVSMIQKMLVCVFACNCLAISVAQESRNQTTGLYELKGSCLTLITDIPLDGELRRWPNLLEQSLKQWRSYFGMHADQFEGLSATLILVRDETRFQDLPSFYDGYQHGDMLYVRDQPSEYYRRHLFLHEATHWVMWHLYGGGGSPWFMEGMAEMQATHSLMDGALSLNKIPLHPKDVQSWGRLAMIDQNLNQAEAPTLSQILAYENDRDRTKRYSWSWAACVFFTNHPKTKALLRESYQTRLDYSNELSREFKSKLTDCWGEVEVDWNGFISDLDFGYDWERSMVVSSKITNEKELRTRELVTLATDRGWQSTGLKLQAGKRVQLKSSGKFLLRKRPADSSQRPWLVEPQGATIEYFRGNPIGCVLATVVPNEGSEVTKRWETIRVGSFVTLKPTVSGTLFLKVNESSNELADNDGKIEVEVSLSSTE